MANNPVTSEYIKIFKGDDTNFNNSKFLTIFLDTEIDLNGFLGIFSLYGFTVTKPVNIETKSISVEIPCQNTAKFPLGPASGIFRLEDTQNRFKTVSNTIPFYITNEIFTQAEESISLPVPENYPVRINLTFGNGGELTTDYSQLQNLPTFNGKKWVGDITNESADIASLTGLNALTQTVNTKASTSDVNNSLSAQQGRIDTIKNDLAGLGDQVHEIEAKIPAEASETNPLADKKYVQDSIQSAGGGTPSEDFATKDDLKKYLPLAGGTVDGQVNFNNVYAQKVYVPDKITGDYDLVISESQRGEPGGFASLDNDAKVPLAQLPYTAGDNITISDTGVISATGGGGGGVDTSQLITVSDLENANQTGAIALLAENPYDTTNKHLQVFKFSEMAFADTIAMRKANGAIAANDPYDDLDVTTKRYVDRNFFDLLGGNTVHGPTTFNDKIQVNNAYITTIIGEPATSIIVQKSGSVRNVADFQWNAVTIGTTDKNQAIYLQGSLLNFNSKKVLTEADKGVSSGICPLGSDSKIPEQYLPTAATRAIVSDEKYGIEAEYALNYGILDCPNGLINYSPNSKQITVNPGIVLRVCGSETIKTTLASSFTYNVVETGEITLFYTPGTESGILEAKEVFFQEEEPTNGVSAYLAWYKPSEKMFYFKSNETGNVWRSAPAVRLARINATDVGITSVNYIGCRILDDDIIVQKSQLVSLQNIVTELQKRIEALEAK